jgi:hypothetical protein
VVSQTSRTAVSDRIGVKHPSLCSTEGPSLRPDLPTLGHCSERRSRMAEGHRSLRRAASLRAVRCNAKL